MSAFAADKAAPAPKEYHVYFGTYTKAKSKGIYRAKLDVASGKLSPAELAAECGDPSFLAVHPNGRALYAINEGSDPQKTPGKGLAAYAIDPASGKLTLLNEQGVGGPGPCHVAVDSKGRTALVANYSGGSVAAIALQPDGRLGAPGSVIKHGGSSVHPTRQKQPHAHAVTLTPDDRHVLSADLGTDKVFVYTLDAEKATLAPNRTPSVSLPPGSGPRHLAFRPDGKFVYVINELTCTMTGFRVKDGAVLERLEEVSTLPPGVTVQQGYSTAEVAMHPNGRFLYGSNRGHNSIAVFAVNEPTGLMALMQHAPTEGRTPRHFAIDPTGTWLLAENQGSDSVVVFKIDQQTGRLTPTGQKLEVPVPVCAVFVAM